MVSIIVFLRLYGPTGSTPHNPYSWGVFSLVPRKEAVSPIAAKDSSPIWRRESCCNGLDDNWEVGATTTSSLLLLLAWRRVDDERWVAVVTGVVNPWTMSMPTRRNTKSMKKIVGVMVDNRNGNGGNRRQLFQYHRRYRISVWEEHRIIVIVVRNGCRSSMPMPRTSYLLLKMWQRDT